MFGGVEAGGTKFVCGIGTDPDNLVTAHFPTLTPGETIGPIIEFFRQHGGPPLRSIGVGSFGPVDLNPASSTFGHITSTPKEGWQNFDLAGSLQRGLNLPVAFDTDVNVALLGEARWGAAKGLDSAVYLTIGTGVGGGAMVQGKVIH